MEGFRCGERGQWGDPTDDDLEQIGESKHRLVGKLQGRYGYAKDDAERRVEEWLTARSDRTVGASAGAPSGVVSADALVANGMVRLGTLKSM